MANVGSTSALLLSVLSLFGLLAYLAFPVQGADVLFLALVLFTLGLSAGCALDILLRNDLRARHKVLWMLACAVAVPFVPLGALVYVFVRNRQRRAHEVAPIARMHPQHR